MSTAWLGGQRKTRARTLSAGLMSYDGSSLQHLMLNHSHVIKSIGFSAPGRLLLLFPPSEAEHGSRCSGRIVCVLD